MLKRAPLPDLLEVVASAIGIEAALKLAAAHGGTRQFIPAHPRPGHWMVEMFGAEDANRLAQALNSAKNGDHYLIPMGPSRGSAERWQRLKTLIDSGATNREITRATGYHRSTIQRHRNAPDALKRVSVALNQLQLFPFPDDQD